MELTIDHGTSRTGRWLRERRVRVALLIAVVEGVLVVVDVIANWVALVIAGAVLAFYVFVGRELRSDTGRQVSWVAAMSQVFVALVPVLAIVLSVFAIIALAVLAAIALLALLADRR